MSDEKDIPPDNGKRPPFTNSEPPPDEHAPKGFFGEQYDSDAAKEWRDKARAANMPAEVSGSGVGTGGGAAGEDYDEDSGGSNVVNPVGGRPG